MRGDSHDEIATQVERHIAKAEGEGGAGDRVETLARDPTRIAVAEMIRVYSSDRNDLATIERLAALDFLPKASRSKFAKKRAAVSTTATP